jgi:Ca2+-binding RTX toxin-like protein
MATVTVGGGQSVQISDPSVAASLAGMINSQVTRPQFSGGSDTVASGQKGLPNHFNLAYSASSTGTTLAAGVQVQEIVDNGTGNDTLEGGNQTSIIIGNNANDTIDVAHDGTVYTGSGNNTVTFEKGNSSDYLFLGSGNNTVNSLSTTHLTVDGGVNGGKGTLNLDGHDTIDLSGKLNLTITGGTDSTIQASGNDTITLGTGSFTIAETGSATVLGGSGALKFTGGGGTDSVVAGSGFATLVGGSGVEYFSAGNQGANVVMQAGTGSDTFVGGTGSDSMTGTGASSNLYEFSTTAAGGMHDIYNFTSGRDHLHLAGYDSAAALSSAQVANGNTTITLSDHTKIVLVGFTHLTGSDFH